MAQMQWGRSPGAYVRTPRGRSTRKTEPKGRPYEVYIVVEVRYISETNVTLLPHYSKCLLISCEQVGLLNSVRILRFLQFLGLRFGKSHRLVQVLASAVMVGGTPKDSAPIRRIQHSAIAPRNGPLPTYPGVKGHMPAIALKRLAPSPRREQYPAFVHRAHGANGGLIMFARTNAAKSSTFTMCSSTSTGVKYSCAGSRRSNGVVISVLMTGAH